MTQLRATLAQLNELRLSGDLRLTNKWVRIH